MIKNKNRPSKLITNAIISAILGAVMGSLLTMFADLTIKRLPIDPVYLVLFFALLVTILAVIILLRIETIDEYRYEIMENYFDGFIRVDNDSISAFATYLVNHCLVVRVVGTARQDVVAGKVQQAGQMYLKSLEERLNRKCKSESDKFKYFRVVPKALKRPLEQHIEVCMDNALKTGNTFDFREIDSFDFNISYQVFDDRDLLLIVDNRLHTGESDNALCLWTRNKEIIKIFINRFDSAWGV